MNSLIPNIQDGPAWDFGLTVRGVDLRFVSPLDMKADLPAVPTPEQAELDRMTRRRRGIFLRLWWWLFGEPGVERSDIPQDGGAEHVRKLVAAMVGPAHADFLATLTTGEHVQIHQVYMGFQEEWCQRIQQWASDMASKQSLEKAVVPSSTAGGEQLMPDTMIEQVTRMFGPPRHGKVPHLIQSDPSGDHQSNGQVRGGGSQA